MTHSIDDLTIPDRDLDRRPVVALSHDLDPTPRHAATQRRLEMEGAVENDGWTE